MSHLYCRICLTLAVKVKLENILVPYEDPKSAIDTRIQTLLYKMRGIMFITSAEVVEEEKMAVSHLC